MVQRGMYCYFGHHGDDRMTNDNASASRSASQRHAKIMNLIQEVGRASVEELASQLMVTPQTIRRDLNDLAELGKLTRVHGGAMVISSASNLAYEARRLVDQAVKRLIGEAAARLVPDNSSLIINAGTTVEAVARALGNHHGLLIVTTNLHAAQELGKNRGAELILAGGAVRRSDGAIVGETAAEQIRQFRADIAVIGAAAIELDGTILGFDSCDTQVLRAIIESSRKVMLVVHSSKFARTAPIRLAHLREVDFLITDDRAPKEIIELCRKSNVDAVIAQDQQ